MFRNRRGQSLVEVIVAIGILAVGGSAVVLMVLGSLRGADVGGQRTIAANYAREGWEGLKSIGRGAYNKLAAGTYGLTEAGGVWTLTPGSDTNGNYTRTVVIEDVQRDGSGDIVLVSGSNDIGTRRIITTITWPSEVGTRTFQTTDYFTNWKSIRWFEDLTAEFDDGTFSNTATSTDDDGEVGLAGLGSASDWGCFLRTGQFNATNAEDAFDVAIVSNTAYIVRATGTSTELQVVNVSTPSAPTLLGSLELGTTANVIAVNGNFAYIGTISDTQEIMVVNISNPASMSIGGSFNAPNGENTTALVANGNRLYVGRESGAGAEFLVLNTSTPTTPTPVGSLEVGDGVNGIAVQGTRAFLATNANAAELWSVSLVTESAPTQLDTVNLAGTENALSVVANDAGNYVWVAQTFAAAAELHAVNATDPSNMTEIASAEFGAVVNDLALVGTDLFVASDLTGAQLRTFKVTNPFTLTARFSADMGGAAWGVASTGSKTVVATANDAGELAVATATTGFTCPAQIGTYTGAPRAVTDLALSGTRVYLGMASGGGDDLDIVSVATPSAPTDLGGDDTGQTVADVAATGNVAYLATASNTAEVQIIDATNPASPTLTSLNLAGNENGTAVFVSGNRLYIGRSTGTNAEFSIYNITTPTSPTLVGSLNLTGSVTAIYVTGTTAYIGSDSDTGELQIVNIATEASPTLTGTLNVAGTANATSVYVVGNRAYLTQLANATTGEFHVVNVTTPATPTIDASVEYGTNVNAVASDGTVALVASDLNASELRVYNITVPATPQLVATVPTGTIDVNDIVISGNNAYLALDSGNELTVLEGYVPSFGGSFTDDTAAEFNLGTYSATQFDTSWIELTGAGQIAGTGTHTSRIIDTGGGASDWLTFGWTTTAPYGKQLPGGGVSETAYTSGNANMTGNSLVMHFDETAGATTFDDASSANNDATCVGATCPTAGVAGKVKTAISCDGVDDFISFGTNLSTVLNGTSSLSFWVKTSQVGSATPWLAPSATGFELGGSGDDIFWGWLDNTGRIGLQAGNGLSAKSTNPINNNVWHHILLTRNSATGAQIVYVDGVAGTSATGETGVKTTTWNAFCRLTENAGAHVYFAGQFDEVAIYNRVIAAPEALQLYQRGALRIKHQVRSCDDAACVGETFIGSDGTAGDFYDETDHASVGFPTGLTLNVANNRYLQYRTTFETDNVLYTPELRTVAITYTEAAGGAFQTNGTYISSIFDAGDTANWNTIDWTEDLACPGSDLQLQIRTATTSGGLAGGLWQGPDGEDADETDFFLNPDGALIHTSHNGDQFIQYRATFSSPGSCTPQLEDIEFTATVF